MSRWLVTGSAGHLGEALVHTLREGGHDVVGLDRLAAPITTVRADLTAPDVTGPLRATMSGVDHVLHTATLHKPHAPGCPARPVVIDRSRGDPLLARIWTRASRGSPREESITAR